MTQYDSSSLEQTQQIAQQIYAQLEFPACVYLRGDLGAGKTTLCQSIIQAAGYQGAVTSPTYNLIQEYPVEQGIIYHMDFYRLESPEEAELLALDDLWSQNCLFLVEWPDKAAGWLPKPDLEINAIWQENPAQLSDLIKKNRSGSRIFKVVTNL